MRKLLLLLTAVAFIFTACEKEDGSVNPASDAGFHKDDCVIVTKMIAGGGKYDENCTGYEVGTITVEESGDCIDVTYTITEPNWFIDVTHLYVGPEGDIPSTKKGNPKIGKFPYKTEHTGGVTTFTYECIPTPAGDYVISAHADTRYDAAGAFCANLPATATIDVSYPGLTSLFDIVVTNAGDFDGTYQAWCIDIGHSISETQYSADVFCIDGDLSSLSEHIDHPEKLAAINWILNQGFVGSASTCGGDFTLGDVQLAIWKLIDKDALPLGAPWLGVYLECRYMEIYNAANAIEDYTPPTGGFAAVIFAPAGDAQVMVLTALFDEEELDETAWGYGYSAAHGYCDDGSNGAVADGISFTDALDYGGSAWGWYFYGCADN